MAVTILENLSTCYNNGLCNFKDADLGNYGI